MDFKNKVFAIVKKIKKGRFLTYKDIARFSGKILAYRAIGNILARNKNSQIPCHRVIKSDYTIGGYLGSQKKSSIKLALLLKEGVIAVMPTDTIYGICGQALNKEVVEKIYQFRKRNTHKPMIILISDFKDLKIFGIKPTKIENKILKKLWPGKISVILDIKDKDKIKKFKYLHRGTNTLALRLPKLQWLLNILKTSGPLVAPSANFENFQPACTIKQAKKYFKNQVVYWDGGKIISKPSVLIKLKNNKIEILRGKASLKL